MLHNMQDNTQHNSNYITNFFRLPPIKSIYNHITIPYNLFDSFVQSQKKNIIIDITDTYTDNFVNIITGDFILYDNNIGFQYKSISKNNIFGELHLIEPVFHSKYYCYAFKNRGIDRLPINKYAFDLLNIKIRGPIFIINK